MNTIENDELFKLIKDRNMIKDQLEAAEHAIVNCVDWANGHEYEWGDRAENAFNFLHQYIEKYQN